MSLKDLKQKLQGKVGQMESNFKNAGKGQSVHQNNYMQQPQNNYYQNYQQQPRNTQQDVKYQSQSQSMNTPQYQFQASNSNIQQNHQQPMNNTQQTYNAQPQQQQYQSIQQNNNVQQSNIPKTNTSLNNNYQQVNNTYQQQASKQQSTLGKQIATTTQRPQDNKNNTSTSNNLIVPDAYNSYQQKYNQAHAKKGFLGKLESKFKKAGTSNQIDTSGVDKFKNSIIDELGYKRLTNDEHHYLVLATPYRATRGYAEMLQIGGASLTNLPPNLADGIMIHFIHFLRAYMADMTFVSIHLPNDSKTQQHYWAGEKRDINYKILRGNLSYHNQEYLLARRKFINAKLKRFQDIDLSVDNQAFVMILFAKTEDELNRDVQYALAFDRDGNDVLKLSFMSVEQKETFLTRLNNPNIVAR